MLNANKLRLLRKANGWTYTELLKRLAEEQGVYCGATAISAYERGKIKNCRIELLLALAAVYDVGLEELLS